MSGAIRPQSNRSRSRNVLASPYARPRQQKKSSWSFSGLLSYINPFAARPSPERSPSPTAPPDSPVSEEDEDEHEQECSQEIPDVAHTLASRGHEIAASLNSRPKTIPVSPPTSNQQHASTPLAQSFRPSSSETRPVSPSFFHEPESPAKNLETVSNFLNSKVGQPITPIEMEGVLSLLQRSTPQDGPAPFRFESRSPSATPARGISPFVPTPIFKFSTPEPATNATPTVTPRRTLSKNPNGVYRWQGGGSARASRTKNRFSSPAFGPSRSTTERIVLKDNGVTPQPKTDSKRRRIGEDGLNSTSASESSSLPASTSAPSALLSGPSTTTAPHAKASAPTTNTGRLRIPALQKPTAPTVPSPLRQTWSEGSPGEPSKAPSPKPSKAANFMAELIKETTPPKRPDVSNPYQIASPVGRVGPRKAPKRTRSTGKPAAPTKEQRDAAEKEKEEDKQKEEIKQITPQAIIEATLPKGSKRSRPPTHFEKSPEKVPFVIEEVEEDEEENSRVGKKSKPSLNGNGPSLPSTMKKSASTTPEIAIEEVSDVEMESSDKRKKGEEKEKEKSSTSPSPSLSLSPPGNRSAFPGYKPSSIPREPSKLRFSVVVEGSSPAPVQPVAEAKGPVPSKPLFATSSTDKMDIRDDALCETTSTLFTKPQETAPAVTTNSFASFTSTISGTSAFSSAPAPSKVTPTAPSDPKEAARALATSSLPTFRFTVPGASAFPSTPEHIKAREQAKCALKSSLQAFDFSAEALKKASAGVKVSDSSICTPTTPTPAPSTGFNWAAAGIKAPAAPAAGSWTCSVCMISNPASKSICEACESPSPSASTTTSSATPAPAPIPASTPAPAPTTGFNWAAAGMKTPAAPATGSWTCSVCMISNSASKDICAACESPR